MDWSIVGGRGATMVSLRGLVSFTERLGEVDGFLTLRMSWVFSSSSTGGGAGKGLEKELLR